jgi:hypothetical protein
MTNPAGLLSMVAALTLAPAVAGAQSAHPVADAAATKLVQKYQSSSCEQLAQERQAPKSQTKTQAEQRVGQMLRQDPQLRADFVGKVAAPVMNKMIECGFVP